MANSPMQKGKTDYVKDFQVIAKNALLFHLAVNNNSGSAFWVQVWDVKQSSDIGTVETIPEFEINLPSNNVAAFPFHRDGYQFGRGIYVRAVTASQGSSLIAANNAKYTFQFDGPTPIT